MAKEFYKVLEVNENATQEEIKKKYRKLALEWHPDKWMNKSLEEREKANEEMRKINQAFEVLGDEEKRKRYDLGESDFTSAFEYNYDYKEEMENINDELKRLNEEQKFLARGEVINRIEFEMLITEIFSSKLDKNLWTPYDTWQKKVWNIEIKDDDTSKYGIDESELNKFKETMINAIRKRKEEWKAGINNPHFDKARNFAIEVIEEAMKKKGLKAGDLGEYSDYKEKINDPKLDRVRKIQILRDKIEDYIRQQGEKHTKKEFDSRIEEERTRAIEEIESMVAKRGLQTQDLGEYSNYKEKIDELGEVWKIRDLRDRIIKTVNNWKGKIEGKDKSKGRDEKRGRDDQFSNKSDDNNQKDKVDYSKLTREELIKEVNQKDLENGSLKEIVLALERKVEELEEEIRELKAEKPQTSRIRQEIQKRESQLQEFRSSLEKINSNDNSDTQNSRKDNSNDKLLAGLIIGGAVLLVVGGLITFLVIKNSKRKKYLTSLKN